MNARANTGRFARVEGPDRAVLASPLLKALETIWAAIRRHHPDVPPAVVVLGSAAMGRGKTTVGHFWPVKWDTSDAGHRPEVLLAGELLADLEQLLEVLVHEAAHGLAFTRKIKDTSRGGTYHNKRYQALAEELGLEVCDHDRFGVETFMTALVRDRYASELAELRKVHAAASHARRVAPAPRRRVEAGGGDEGGEGGGGEGGDEGGEVEERPTSGRRLKLECECERPRRIWIACKGLEEGPITCNACGARFAPQDRKDMSHETH